MVGWWDEGLWGLAIGQDLLPGKYTDCRWDKDERGLKEGVGGFASIARDYLAK